jgi:hypothetical protein
MLVVSTREFRDNQRSYLDKIDSGIEIRIQRGKRKLYKVVPVSDDDTLMSREAFFAKIDHSLNQAKEGKVYSMLPNESLSAFLKRTENV